jgi:hypothetical protein
MEYHDAQNVYKIWCTNPFQTNENKKYTFKINFNMKSIIK